MGKINLHIGAHKTATTHLQRMLASSETLLRNNRIALSLPDEIRANWLPLFFKYQFERAPGVVRKLHSLRPTEAALWIFSEENISGLPRDLARHETLYPSIGSRLSDFVDLYSCCETSVFFSIRSYDTYFRSIYLEYVRNNGYTPFEDYYEEERFRNFNWAEVIASICSAVPAQNVRLWRYEDFQALLPTILQHMTGLANVEPILDGYPAEATRRSLSEKALEGLKSTARVIPDDELRSLVERLAARYPAGAENGIFNPFSDSQKHEMRQRYRDDLHTLTRDFPKLRLLAVPNDPVRTA